MPSCTAAPPSLSPSVIAADGVAEDEDMDVDASDPFAPHPAGDLAARHPHARDKDLHFDEESHTYTWLVAPGVTERAPISVSTLLKPVFDDFDAHAVVVKLWKTWLRNEDHKYHHLIDYLHHVRGLEEPQIADEMAKLWRQKGDLAAADGTAMHKTLELFINGMYVPTERELAAAGGPPHELQAFLAMNDNHWPELQMRPYRTEFSMAWTDEATGRPLLAGQADYIAIDKHGRFHLFDWKRTKPSKMVLGRKVADTGRIFKTKYAKEPFQAHIMDDYVKYSAQLHIYAFILREQYGIDCVSCHMVQIHPDLPRWGFPDGYNIVEALDVSAEAATLCRQHAAKVRHEWTNPPPELDRPRCVLDDEF